MNMVKRFLIVSLIAVSLSSYGMENHDLLKYWQNKTAEYDRRVDNKELWKQVLSAHKEWRQELRNELITQDRKHKDSVVPAAVAGFTLNEVLLYIAFVPSLFWRINPLRYLHELVYGEKI